MIMLILNQFTLYFQNISFLYFHWKTTSCPPSGFLKSNLGLLFVTQTILLKNDLL
jgi:hypothetical protein